MTRQQRGVLIKSLIGLVLLALVGRSVDWERLGELLQQARPGPVALAFALFLLACALTALRWRVLLGAFPKSPSLAMLTRISFIGVFLNTFIPGGVAGDLVRGYRIQDSERGQAPGYASIFTDRFLGLCGLCLLAVIGAATIMREMIDVGLAGIFLGIVAGLIGLGLFFYNRRIGRIVESLLKRLGDTGTKVSRLLEAIRVYRGHGGRVALALGITFASHLLFVTAVAVLARSLQIDLAWGHFLAFVPVIALLSAVPLSVNGLGIREAGYVLLFTRVGVVREQALGLSFLHFGLLILLGLVGGTVLAIETLAGDRKALA